MATPQQIETKLRAPRCLNNIPLSARAQCPGTGTKSGRGLTNPTTHQVIQLFNCLSCAAPASETIVIWIENAWVLQVPTELCMDSPSKTLLRVAITKKLSYYHLLHVEGLFYNVGSLPSTIDVFTRNITTPIISTAASSIILSGILSSPGTLFAYQSRIKAEQTDLR